jgi:hypothetical protein
MLTVTFTRAARVFALLWRARRALGISRGPPRGDSKPGDERGLNGREQSRERREEANEYVEVCSTSATNATYRSGTLRDSPEYPKTCRYDTRNWKADGVGARMMLDAAPFSR